MTNDMNSTPLWLNLKTEYIDENFEAVKDYLQKMLNSNDKDSFYITTIKLLCNRVEDLIQDDYKKGVGENDTEEENIFILKLLALFLIVVKTDTNYYKEAFFFFVLKVMQLSPKIFSESFVASLISIDVHKIEINQIITWEDFNLFSSDIIANRLMAYNLPQIDSRAVFENKGCYEISASEISIYSSRKVKSFRDKVASMPLFNDRMQLYTSQNSKLKKSEASNVLSLKEFVHDFIDEQRNDVAPTKRKYSEGSICEVVISRIDTEICVQTIDENYERITGKIDFSSSFYKYNYYYYYKGDFFLALKANDKIKVTYIGNNKFDISETFINYVLEGYEEDVNQELLAEVMNVNREKGEIAFGTEYGYIVRVKDIDLANETNKGDKAKVTVNNRGKDKKTGTWNTYIYATFEDFEDNDDFSYQESKRKAINSFIITDDSIGEEKKPSEIRKEEIKLIYRILIAFQQQCVDRATERYKMLCVAKIMAELVECNNDSKYIDFLQDYLQNLIFFATDKQSEMKQLNYQGDDSEFVTRNKRIIEILKMYGRKDLDIDVNSFEDDKMLYDLATLVESCNRLDGIITPQTQNVIKRKIIEMLSISTDGKNNLDEENGIYLGTEDSLKEFKTSFFYAPIGGSNQKNNIFKGVCAFLNSMEGGTLYLGVNDLGYVKGIKEDIDYLENHVIGDYTGVDGLMRYITDEMLKVFDVDVIERVKISAIYDDNVLAFKIQPYEYGLVKFNDKIYLRVNSESIDISNNAIAKSRIEERKQKLLQNEEDKDPKLREIKKQVEDAISQKKQVILHNYCSSSSGSKKNRKVEIFRFYPERQLIMCYDVDNNGVRSFKITRIGGYIEILDCSWEHESAHKELKIDVFHMSGIEPIPICLRLNLRAKNLLIEEFPQSKDSLIRESDDSWLFDTEIYKINGLARFYMGLVDDIEIISAPGLKEYMQEKMKQISQKLS